MQEEAARIAAQVAGISGAGSEDVLEAKRLVAQKSAELDAVHTCVPRCLAACYRLACTPGRCARLFTASKALDITFCSLLLLLLAASCCCPRCMP